MPDEIGTETGRSDAPSADDSTIGDSADDKANTVAEEKDSEPETPRDGQDAVDGDELAAVDEAAPTEDLKVVVSIKGGRATIGVQRPSADPHIETFDDDDLSGLAQEVLPVTERARAKWEDQPKHPTYERPAPPAVRRNRRQQAATRATTAETEAQQAQQQTLRLF
ncbi:MAG: hypothetical protein OXE50_02810 [Chloroflexi bacterium]|nr:hypothetical protein [Chloroflexota bacterium]